MELRLKRSLAVLLAAVLTVLMIALPGNAFLRSTLADEELQGKICFDGDSEYEWAHFYSVDGIDATIGDLNITVLDQDGNVIPSNQYELHIYLTWWDEEKQTDMKEEVFAPFGIYGGKEAGGFTEYLAEAKFLDEENESIENSFFITDKYSLNFVCGDVSFANYTKKGGWRMVNRYWVDLDKLAPPIVRNINGPVLTEGVDYEVTYFTRVGDLEDFNTDREKVLAGDKKLEGLPDKPGEYVVKVKGLGEYYGEQTVLLDVEGEEPVTPIEGWVQYGDRWKYFFENGTAATGWQLIKNKWYYFDQEGWMQTGWQLVNGKWYYLAGSGAMLTGWQFIGNKWYYLSASGAMLTGWQYIGNKWYYLAPSGAMLTGWQYIKNGWYYMYPNGVMAANTWIGNYYVGADGRWIYTR